MAATVAFKERLTNFYRYPRICLFQDPVEDQRQIASYLDQPHPGEKLVYIYIHVPFCTSMCNYCPFYHTYWGHSGAGERARFVDAVVAELRMYASRTFFRGTPVCNVNFGGGTPFLLETHHLARILETVQREFAMAERPVISIEGDPIALQDRDKLAALKACGFTRVSFGLQTFNERLRKKLRVDSSGIDVYRCVDAVTKSFDEWGCDILYNCPDQNVTEIRYNVDRICELEPSIVDAYDLNISPNTKLSKLVAFGHFRTNPSNRSEIEQFAALRETFLEHGFEQVRSVNFKPPRGPLHRNGILHQFSEDVLGIGPSARTFLYSGGRNYRNHCSTEKYVASVEKGELPIEAGNVVPASVLEERDMVLFPYYLEVAKSSINYPRFAPKIAEMVASGYVEDRGATIALTELGKLWAGNVQYHFHSDEEKAAMGRSMFRSLQEGRNLFNQDLDKV
jgi:coproporphyrinogen III oxidase-like Fe-S oxidoreductase